MLIQAFAFDRWEFTMRNTIQRQIILDTLKLFDTHPTVDALFAEINKKHPTISKATVYRNLRNLSEIGLVLQIAVADDVARYDGCTTQHYHLKCKVCNGIFDVKMESINGINEAVGKANGFHIDKHDIMFTGTCANCISN